MNQTDIDILKSQWQSLNAPRKATRPVTDARGLLHNVTTFSARENMIRLYRRLTVLCYVWVLLSLLMSEGHILPVWMTLVLALFFAICGSMCLVVLHAARDIDFVRMNVVEAMEAVCKVQRYRLLQKTAGMIMAVPMLGAMFYYFASQSIPMFVGGICGLIVGGTIGIIMDMRVRRWIREMKAAIRDARQS